MAKISQEDANMLKALLFTQVIQDLITEYELPQKAFDYAMERAVVHFEDMTGEKYEIGMLGE